MTPSNHGYNQPRIYCLQFVVQSIEWLSEEHHANYNNDNEQPEMVIDKLGLRFGEQSVTLAHLINFSQNQRVLSARFGKICFFEEDQLGFEIVAKYGNNVAKTGVSFITFEDKKNCSVLQATFTLKNSSRLPIFALTCIASRHLLKNLGKSLETVNSGTQTTIPPPLVNAKCQTKLPKKANSSVQTSKILQRHAWTLDNVTMTDVGTQTDPDYGVHFDELGISVAEQRKALLRMVVMLMAKVSEKMQTQKRTTAIMPKPAESVVEVDVKAAKQFGEMRKRQIEQMRERLRAMTAEREEVLAAANARLHPADPSSGSESKAASDGHVKKESTSQSVSWSRSVPGSSKATNNVRLTNQSEEKSQKSPTPISSNNVPRQMPPVPTLSKKTELPSTSEDIIMTPEPSITSKSANIPPKMTPEPPPPEIATERSAGSSVPSPLASSRSESGLQSIADAVPTISTTEKSPRVVIPSPAKVNNGFLMPAFHRDSIISPKVRPPAVNPFTFSGSPSTPKIEEQKEDAISSKASSSKRSKSSSSSKSDKTASSVSSSSASGSEESTSKSQSESSEASETGSTASSSGSGSSSSEESELSTPRPPEPTKKSSKTAPKKKESPPSSASSTFGGGSVATVESIAEELPSASDNSVESIHDTIESLKSVSSVGSAVSELGELAQSQELSPLSRYLKRGSKRFSSDYSKRKSLHTDSVSSYAPSEM